MGDEVSCALGPDEWGDGTVVARMFRDESMPPGLVAPYQVQLHAEGGRLIWAPSDCDSVICRRGSGRTQQHGQAPARSLQLLVSAVVALLAVLVLCSGAISTPAIYIQHV